MFLPPVHLAPDPELRAILKDQPSQFSYYSGFEVAFECDGVSAWVNTNDANFARLDVAPRVKEAAA